MTMAYYNAQSISLPSRPQPATLRVLEQLDRLKASEDVSSSSPSSICHKLSGLVDLYDCIDDVLHLPINQQLFARECSEKWVDDTFDRSLRLLDVCGFTRDVLLQTKEHTQELQSILRRRQGGDPGLGIEVDTYTTSRKKLKKAVLKFLHKSKSNMESKSFSPLDKELEIVAVISSMLREVENISLTIFESLLFFICGQKAKLRPSGWTMVSKLMLGKRMASEEEVDFSETEKLDAALFTLKGHKSSKGSRSMCAQDLQKELEIFELAIVGLDDELDCMFKSLIKTRVSLRNILNH